MAAKKILVILSFLAAIGALAVYNIAIDAGIEPVDTAAEIVNDDPPTPADALQTYLVTRVVDGDTIELASGEKVRYIGIDTPETVDPRKPVQCFGRESSDRNKELVGGKMVRLEKDVSDRDRYGRLLRYVYVGDLFVNLELVRNGYARLDTVPPDVKFSQIFLAAQEQARQQGVGLWGSCE